VGGVVTPLLGFIADQAGLRTALLLLVLVPAIAVPLAFSLPRPQS
jgi:fucose permease